MNLLVRNLETRRALLEMLCALPAEARGFALERVAFASVGGAVGPGLAYTRRGFALDREALGGTEALVVIADGPAARNVAAHEVAHCYLRHDSATVDAEREAAALAREWGFDGPSSDPEAAVAAFEAGSEPEHLIRSTVKDGALRVECHACGSRCRVYAPTAPGLPAEVGVECSRCGWLLLLNLGALRTCECGQHAAAVWSEGATPVSPTATAACTCGRTVTLRLEVNAPEPEVPEWRWAVREAAGLVAGLRASPSDPNWSALWLARRRILRAAHLLDDARGPVLAGLAVEVAAAGADLRHNDPEAAGKRLASVAAGLADVRAS
jgi:hypothetical protein